MATRHSPLLEGLSDAIGFVAGAMAGFGLGQLIGLNLFEPGYGVAPMGGIILVGLGAGLGKRWARQWRERSDGEPS